MLQPRPLPVCQENCKGFIFILKSGNYREIHWKRQAIVCERNSHEKSILVVRTTRDGLKMYVPSRCPSYCRFIIVCRWILNDTLVKIFFPKMEFPLVNPGSILRLAVSGPSCWQVFRTEPSISYKYDV